MIGTMRQKLIGKHNARNFMAACALLIEKGFTFEEIKEILPIIIKIEHTMSHNYKNKYFFPLRNFAVSCSISEDNTY